MSMTDHDMIANLHRRMDSQDRILLEIDRKITSHMAESDTIRPALEELVSLWKGSKILIPIMAGSAAMIWAVIVWAKEHLR
jgi:hypothetical protein